MTSGAARLFTFLSWMVTVGLLSSWMYGGVDGFLIGKHQSNSYVIRFLKREKNEKAVRTAGVE